MGQAVRTAVPPVPIVDHNDHCCIPITLCSNVISLGLATIAPWDACTCIMNLIEGALTLSNASAVAESCCGRTDWTLEPVTRVDRQVGYSTELSVLQRNSFQGTARVIHSLDVEIHACRLTPRKGPFSVVWPTRAPIEPAKSYVAGPCLENSSSASARGFQVGHVRKPLLLIYNLVNLVEECVMPEQEDSLLRPRFTRLVAIGLATLGVAATLVSAPSASADQVAYLVNVTVRPGYNFRSPDDALSYGYRICDKISQGRSFTQLVSDIKTDFNTADEFQASYLISQAAQELCPAMIWQLRNSAAGYRPGSA